MPLPAFFVEIIMPIINASPTRRLVFQYLVPVHVEVEDGLVTRVTVIDETPVRRHQVARSRPVHKDTGSALVLSRVEGGPSPAFPIPAIP